MTAAAERREISAGGVVVHRSGAEIRYLLICDAYRNWGFPKGHVEAGESFEAAATREVIEETGLRSVHIRAPLEAIEWHFRIRGDRVHKTCHFFLMETDDPDTTPQLDEGITACRWTGIEEAQLLVSYDDARRVLRKAHASLTRDGDGRSA